MPTDPILPRPYFDGKVTTIHEISGIESPALERIIEVRSLITNCSQNVYVISTMLQFQAFPSYRHMTFTYFQSINICSPYEFVDIRLRS